MLVLYTRYKPNVDWLQANEKMNPQLFWDDDLHLSKTGYQKFATSLFNFISSCNTSKSTSFDLRKIDKSFPPLSRTNIHIPTKEIVLHHQYYHHHHLHYHHHLQFQHHHHHHYHHHCYHHYYH